MFGFIHESIRQLIIRKYGEELWLQILSRAGFENGKENVVNHYYNDSDTYLLVDSVSAITKLSREQVWEMYGTFLIVYTMELGWDELVRSMSPNLKGFLDSLDSLHYFIDHVVYKANLRGPSFRCEQNNDGTITLHYFTGRPGLYPIVKGVLKEVARCVFNIEISLTITGRTQRSVQTASGGERIEEHVIFLIKTISNTRGEEVPQDAMIGPKVSAVEGEGEPLHMSLSDFSALLPYHVVFDEDCKLVQVGKELYNHVPKDLLQPGTPIMRMFELTRPQIPFDFDNVCNFINAVFVLQVRTAPTDLRRQKEAEAAQSGESYSSGAHLKLKGQMMRLASGKYIIYLCSPYVTSIQELMDFGMRLTAMPLHDATRDLILLNQQRLSDVEVNLQLEANNEQLEAMAKDLEVEHSRSDIILKDMLPSQIANQLLNGDHIEPCEYEEATVMFSDIPNFTSILPQTNPKEIVQLLNDLFTRFDRLISFHQVYKVETVGDSYVTVCGIPEYIPQHSELICHTALGMIWEARSVLDPILKSPLQIRIGIHSGPLVAGVVGSKMPRYSLFGETVTTASRLESHGLPGKIHCSDRAFKCANETGRFEFQSRGRITIKGKGEMDTYFLLRSNKKSVWEIVHRERDVNLNSIDGYDELESGADFVDVKKEIETTRPIKESKACSIQ